MNKLKRFSLIVLGTLIFALCPFVFTGCKEENKTCKLYVFSTVGGHVEVEDHEEIVEFGDEGSKVFVYEKNDDVELKAVADAGYHFVEWQFADNFASKNNIKVNEPEIEIELSGEEVVVKAVFELTGEIVTYNVSYPSETTGYTFDILNGYNTTINAGENFKFEIVLDEDYSNSEVVVKANNSVIEPDIQGVYTVSNINQNIEITVEGVELNQEEPVEPTIYQVGSNDNRFTIVPVGQADCKVEEGGEFTFTIKLTEGYVIDNTLIVKANDVELIEIDGKYTINSVEQDIVITVDGIIEDIIEEPEEQAKIYVFTLTFDDEIYSSVATFVPEVIELTIKDSEKKEQYASKEFVVKDPQYDEQYTLKDIVDTINELCANIKVYSFTLSGLDFIVVDGDSITVDWNLLTTSVSYDLKVETIIK